MKKYSYRSKTRFKKVFKFSGFIFLSAGITAVIYIFFPIISFYIYLSSAFASNSYESPVPDRFVVRNEVEISDLLVQGVSSFTYDYTDADNWFPALAHEANINDAGVKVDSYTLSIPKLGIEDAQVSAKDTDLSKHLVQYFTTSTNPTEKGTSVIFGHSTLPQLFDPQNYKTIFATIHTLKSGDEFTIKVNNKEYKYRIFSIKIVDPEDPNIFSQSFDNSYITLVTCTPPGTVWKRLVLRASQIS